MTSGINFFKKIKSPLLCWFDKDETGDDINLINQYMQAHYPGKYIVEEYYDSERMAFARRLVFDDPHEEVIFYLKYSDE